MGAVKSTLAINDGMTPALRHINKAMSLMLNNFNAVQRASGNAIDTKDLAIAKRELGKANDCLDAMEQSYRDINRQQDEFNGKINSGTSMVGGLLSKVKGLAAAYLGMQGVNWVKDSLVMFDESLRPAKQLKTVLSNMGAADGAFERLQAKANKMQETTLFDGDSMLGGAAEFATYMSDDKAIEVMMDTLANYAAGMSGGGEVGYDELINYATGLGKIMTGSYDAMTKKGFEFTEQQKKIIETGTDMEKALAISEVINESWAGLADSMSNTPEGKIIQLNNTFGDMREELGEKCYPAVMNLLNTISNNSSKIHGIVVGLSKPINLIVLTVTKIISAAAGVYNFINKNWSKIGPIVYGIVTAFGLYNAVLLAHKAYLAGAAAIQGIKAVAEYASAKATMKAAEAAGVNAAALGTEASAAALAAAGITAEQLAAAAATTSQVGFNTALWACPTTWIAAGILLLIVLFLMFTEEIVGAIWWLGALFKNIGIWFANVGIAAWQIIKNIGFWFANLGLSIWQVIKNIGAWFGNLGQSVWAIIQNVGAWFGNLGAGVWAVLKATASNISVAFNNAWVGIQQAFWTCINSIMQGLKSLADKANKALGWMGVDIDTSGFDFAAKKIDELESKKESFTDIGEAWTDAQNTFEYKDVGDAFDTYDYGSVGDAYGTIEYIGTDKISDGYNTFDVFQKGWGSEAYNAGADIGAGISGWIDDNLSMNALMGKMGTNPEELGLLTENNETLEGISDDTTSLSDSVDTSSEELEYLRDIAEREAVNRFTTAEVKVDFNNNNSITSDVDVDGVISRWTEEFKEAVSTAAEGDY